MPNLFGREDDLDQLESATSGADYVTLIGPGGVGKTALAKAWARHHGAAWLNLTAARSADDVAFVLNGLPSDGHVVLDNCEQVVEHLVPQLIDRLTKSSGFKLLCTSRIALDLAEEVLV
jgi:predicted ATPase